METIFLFCCRSCLKGEGVDDEYYTRLGLESKNVSSDAIKKAYKKKSLQLHPDRLAQKGITVTPDHNRQFQGLKEAYDILSDPKKRKIYDAIGANGVKLMENPQEVNPVDFIKNFQHNRADRMKIALALALICSIIVLIPVLFCLKADGDIDNAPWLAIWTPMWVVNAMMLTSAVLFLVEKEDLPEEEEGEEKEEPIPLSTKALFFVKTLSFILIQVFVLLHLDGNVDWSWSFTFLPWFVYEVFVIIDYVKAAVSEVPPLDLSNEEVSAEEDPHEFLVHKMEKEQAHFRAQVEQATARKKITNSTLRVWTAIFLALQLDDTVMWDWGLVMLPIWLTFVGDLVNSRLLKSWGGELLEGIDQEALMKGEIDDPEVMMRAQHGQELQAAGGTFCCTLLGPVLMAILLVSRLEASTFSTFIIFIPVFVVLYCCVFAVGCGFCCLSNVPTDSFDDDVASDDPGTSMMHQHEQQQASGADHNQPHSAEIGEMYKPPVTDDLESNQQYGTFNNPESSSPSSSQPEVTPQPQEEAHVLTSAEVEVDID